MAKKPNINRAINKIEKRSKYFSIFSVIFLPKILIKPETMKNLAPLPIIEAPSKTKIFNLNKPAPMVITL